MNNDNSGKCISDVFDIGDIDYSDPTEAERFRDSYAVKLARAGDGFVCANASDLDAYTRKVWRERVVDADNKPLFQNPYTREAVTDDEWIQSFEEKVDNVRRDHPEWMEPLPLNRETYNHRYGTYSDTLLADTRWGDQWRPEEEWILQHRDRPIPRYRWWNCNGHDDETQSFQDPIWYNEIGKSKDSGSVIKMQQIEGRQDLKTCVLREDVPHDEYTTRVKDPLTRLWVNPTNGQLLDPQPNDDDDEGDEFAANSGRLEIDGTETAPIAIGPDVHAVIFGFYNDVVQYIPILPQTVRTIRIETSYALSRLSEIALHEGLETLSIIISRNDADDATLISMHQHLPSTLLDFRIRIVDRNVDLTWNIPSFPAGLKSFNFECESPSLTLPVALPTMLETLYFSVLNIEQKAVLAGYLSALPSSMTDLSIEGDDYFIDFPETTVLHEGLINLRFITIKASHMKKLLLPSTLRTLELGEVDLDVKDTTPVQFAPNSSLTAFSLHVSSSTLGLIKITADWFPFPALQTLDLYFEFTHRRSLRTPLMINRNALMNNNVLKRFSMQLTKYLEWDGDYPRFPTSLTSLRLVVPRLSDDYHTSDDDQYNSAELLDLTILDELTISGQLTLPIIPSSVEGLSIDARSLKDLRGGQNLTDLSILTRISVPFYPLTQIPGNVDVETGNSDDAFQCPNCSRWTIFSDLYFRCSAPRCENVIRPCTFCDHVENPNGLVRCEFAECENWVCEDHIRFNPEDDSVMCTIHPFRRYNLRRRV